MKLSKTRWSSGYGSLGMLLTLFALVKRHVEEFHLLRCWRLERVVPPLHVMALYRRDFHPAPAYPLE
jgi:hypothetical protein